MNTDDMVDDLSKKEEEGEDEECSEDNIFRFSYYILRHFICLLFDSDR